MLFTPEMEELLPQLGSKVRKSYKMLQKEFAESGEIAKMDTKTLQWAFDVIEEMKPVFVGVKHLSLYQTMLAFLQMTLAQGLPAEASEKAFRNFVYWTDKLSQFKEREKWWLYANNLVSKF